MQLLNAFSLQMLDLSNGATVSFQPAKVWKDVNGLWVYEDPQSHKAKALSTLDSMLGHQDIANILGCKMNRVSSHLERGETALVAQIMGGRLPEGTTVLPDGVKIQFFWVTVEETF